VEVPIVKEKQTTENIKKKEVKVEEANKGPKKAKERVNVQLH
jgi:hypothetical protein